MLEDERPCLARGAGSRWRKTPRKDTAVETGASAGATLALPWSLARFSCQDGGPGRGALWSQFTSIERSLGLP